MGRLFVTGYGKLEPEYLTLIEDFSSDSISSIEIDYRDFHYNYVVVDVYHSSLSDDTFVGRVSKSVEGLKGDFLGHGFSVYHNVGNGDEKVMSIISSKDILTLYKKEGYIVRVYGTDMISNWL